MRERIAAKLVESSAEVDELFGHLRELEAGIDAARYAMVRRSRAPNTALQHVSSGVVIAVAYRGHGRSALGPTATPSRSTHRQCCIRIPCALRYALAGFVEEGPCCASARFEHIALAAGSYLMRRRLYCAAQPTKAAPPQRNGAVCPSPKKSTATPG